MQISLQFDEFFYRKNFKILFSRRFEILHQSIYAHSVENPKVNVEYHGILDRPALNRFYSQLDMLLFPSLMKESLGLVVLEAMAFSVPVAASNIGALREYLIDGENGFLFEPNDVDGFLRVIRTFTNLPNDKIRLMRENARTTASRYDDSKILDSLWTIFNEYDACS